MAIAIPQGFLDERLFEGWRLSLQGELDIYFMPTSREFCGRR
jgi:hypothetical protein